MRRLSIRIGLCLLIVILPAAGLPATTAACDDGIRAQPPRHDCSNCCCEPAICTCELEPVPTQPAGAPAAPALVLPATEAPCLIAACCELVEAGSATVSRLHLHVPFHPENRLERLRVLQV